MSKTKKEVITYKSKEVRTTTEGTTLGKVAKGTAIILGGLAVLALLSGGGKK